MSNEVTIKDFARGLIPFKLSGDFDSFELEYMPYFICNGLSEEYARNIVSSIWLFANEQWTIGYNQGKSDPEFDDSQNSIANIDNQ